MTRPSLVTARPSIASYSPSDRSSISRSSMGGRPSTSASTSTSTSSPQPGRVASRYVSTSPLGYNTSAASSSSSSVSCEGYLRMKKRSALTWSTRFVILRGRDLYVFYSKQDAMHRRNLVDTLELEGGKIAAASSRVDLGLELRTTDKREFHARVFSRADLARWVTAFHRLAIKNETSAAGSASNKRAKHESEPTSTEPNQQEETSKSGPVPPQEGEEEECNPVVQSGETRKSGERRRVSFHGSVMVRMIPALPQEQLPELFYTKAEVEKFSAQATSIFSRTEDAVSCACLALRRPALLHGLHWRSRQAAV